METRADVVPDRQDAFLVIDAALSVQAMSGRAEALLDVREELAVNRPVAELLVPASAEAGASAGFAAAIVDVVGGGDGPSHACGPPRAALLVLETTRARNLRVQS
jgi:hypothetical protein